MILHGLQCTFFLRFPGFLSSCGASRVCWFGSECLVGRCSGRTSGFPEYSLPKCPEFVDWFETLTEEDKLPSTFEILALPLAYVDMTGGSSIIEFCASCGSGEAALNCCVFQSNGISSVKPSLS